MKKALQPMTKSNKTEGELPTQELLQISRIILSGVQCWAFRTDPSAGHFGRIGNLACIQIRRERKEGEIERERERGRDRQRERER